MNRFLFNKIQQMREQLDRETEQKNAAGNFPPEIEEQTGLPYGAGCAPQQRMDVYRPRARDKALPVLVNLHGGGLLMGRKEQNRLFCARLAQKGFLVFGLEYPLAPEAQVYEQLAVVECGLDAVDARLEALGGDRERVYLTGDSAGAFLGVYAVAAQRSPELAAAAGVTPSGLPVRALGLISGMFYTRRPDKIGLLLTSSFYGKDWRKHPFRPYMNPEHPAVAGSLPPCFLVTSDGDFLQKYTLDFAAALRRAGVPCTLENYPGGKRLAHAFAAIEPDWPESRDAAKKMAAFLLKYGG